MKATVPPRPIRGVKAAFFIAEFGLITPPFYSLSFGSLWKEIVSDKERIR